MARTLPPVQAIRAEIDALFTEGRDLVEVIEDVARLGHKDINETYKTYAHLLEEAWDRALDVMETAYREAITPTKDRTA